MRPLLNTFLKGLFFALPLAVTFGLLYWVFLTAENLLKIPLMWVLPEGTYMTGMGVLSAFLLIFMLGILVQAYVTRRILRFVDELVARTPFVKTLYTTARDFMNLFASDKEKTMHAVVSITFDNDVKLMGFVTNSQVRLDDGEPLWAVYLPMSYQVGGYTLLVPPSRCDVLDVSVKWAMQQVLTAHVVQQPKTPVASSAQGAAPTA
jgi:uncharacterized membrane protein